MLYVGDQEGNMRGLEASSGAELWSASAGGLRGGGFALVDGIVFTGVGFHFSESDREPLMGGLVAFTRSGTNILPPEPTSTTDCLTDYTMAGNGSFTDVYQGVICATRCRACHGPSRQGALELVSKQASYQNLVQVAAGGESCLASGHTLVQPGNADGSLLYTKIAASASCGDAMPPGDPANSPITSAMLSAVRAWIDAGAPNN